ncbi:MAG: hypothetical protein H6568_17080, partial [Lewinellaceae bacterium]|nr:hypothetical protein [Lewinellaceae bacterium]
MLYRSFLLRLFPLVVILWMSQDVRSQTVVYSPLMEVPTVCQQHNQSMTLIHTGQDVLDLVAVTVHLPCGFQYIPGSVTGIIEDDLGDLQHPVFSVDDV